MKQLFTFFGLAYLISWGIWFPLYAHLFGLNSLPTFSFHHGLGSLGPLVSAFLTTAIYSGTEGIKQLLKKCVAFQPLIYLIIALTGPFLLAIISSIANSLMNNAAFEMNGLFKTKEFPEFNSFMFFIYNLVFYGFGEEVGWRGFALPRFQNKFNALTSSLILTFFGQYGICHYSFIDRALLQWTSREFSAGFLV